MYRKYLGGVPLKPRMYAFLWSDEGVRQRIHMTRKGVTCGWHPFRPLHCFFGCGLDRSWSGKRLFPLHHCHYLLCERWRLRRHLHRFHYLGCGFGRSWSCNLHRFHYLGCGFGRSWSCSRLASHRFHCGHDRRWRRRRLLLLLLHLRLHRFRHHGFHAAALESRTGDTVHGVWERTANRMRTNRIHTMTNDP